MSERENVCLSPNRASVLIPSPATSGGLLPRLTPPPPSKLISPPPLSATATTPQKARSPVQISPLKGTASKPSRSGCAFPTTEVPVTQTSQIRCPESEIYTSIPNGTVHNCFEGLRPLPRKNTFPLNTNRASAPSPPSPSPSLNPFLHRTLAFPQSYKARVGTDKSLKRLAPTEYSESGIPQVTVPDEVFERGAAMLQDYIVGSFFAKMPSYKAIENVLNFLWGKGAKLEIHTNKINRTLLVRIPNQFIRKR
ncbi:extensin-like [Raphanus sativus]|nr:extensin-like [Raphanus sativus]